jgi:hypothetical protein
LKLEMLGTWTKNLSRTLPATGFWWRQRPNSDALSFLNWPVSCGMWGELWVAVRCTWAPVFPTTTTFGVLFQCDSRPFELYCATINLYDVAWSPGLPRVGVWIMFFSFSLFLYMQLLNSRSSRNAPIAGGCSACWANRLSFRLLHLSLYFSGSYLSSQYLFSCCPREISGFCWPFCILNGYKTTAAVLARCIRVKKREKGCKQWILLSVKYKS